MHLRHQARRHAGRATELVRGAVGLLRVSRAAAGAHDTSMLAAARRLRTLRGTHGFAYDEALTLGLLDPAMSPAARDGHVSRHFNVTAQLRLNGHDEPPIVTEKLVFQRYCEAFGIPVPPLIAVIDRTGGCWLSPGRAIPLDAGGVEDLPSSFVVKPAAGYEGLGVLLLHRTADGGLTDHEGRPTTLDALIARLRADPRFDSWIVQERLRNHPELAALAGSETLHTVRLTTLVDRRGDSRIIAASLRLGLSGGAVDNFHKGALGNVFCLVDIGTGVVGEAGWMRPDGPGVCMGPTVPGSSVRPAGVQLPHWRAACALVLGASEVFLPLRTIGWDVALTADGPVLVEANTNYGLPPVPGNRAIVARLEAEIPAR